MPLAGRSGVRFCAVVLVALAGCVVDAPDREAAPPPFTVTRLSVVGSDGSVEPAWNDKRDVFLLLDGPPGEYAFRVLDLHGEVVSSEDEASRHFVAPARVQLAPFADSALDEQGTMHYLVQVAPVDDGFATSSLKATFAIAAWPSR